MGKKHVSEASRSLIVVPAAITFAVTLLRLVGELLNWSPTLFSRVGGGFSLVGITWLIPVFGVYFALKLNGQGEGPASGWKASGWALIGLLFMVATVVGTMKLPRVAILIVTSISFWLIIAVVFRAWPALARTLLTYGFAARIPVAIVMLVATFAGWGTHYDTFPPEMAQVDPIVRWISTGLVPQMTGWMCVTVLVGMLVGGVAAALAGRRQT